MSPRSIQLNTGKILTIAGGASSGYVCDSVVDPITGKILVMASHLTSAIKDTYIQEILPDANFEISSFLNVRGINYDVNKTILLVPASRTLNIYAHTVEASHDISVFELDPAFDITTVTWNTQPTAGDLIEIVTIPAVGWYALSTGSTGAILIQMTDDSHDDFIQFHSMEYTDDPSLRPYIS